jgi:hypothetical protein
MKSSFCPYAPYVQAVPGAACSAQAEAARIEVAVDALGLRCAGRGRRAVRMHRA